MTHITGPTASPQHIASTPLDVTTMDNHKHLLHNTIYHGHKWREDTLTAKQLCQHVDNGLIPNKLDKTNPEDKNTPIPFISFKIDWKPAGTGTFGIYRTHTQLIRKAYVDF
jgi:hypothetical protein